MRKNFDKLTMPEIFNVLVNASYCNLAMSYINQPYIVPLDFKLCKSDSNGLIIRLKSYDDGKKIKLLHENPKVCVQFTVSKFNKVWTVNAFGYAKVVNNMGLRKCPLRADYLILVDIYSITGRKYYL